MKCHCGKEAVIYLNYSKIYLCKEHFFTLVEKRVKKAIRHFNMISPQDHIAVGYSGGKDSIALLYILKKLSKKMGFKLSAITLIEGISNYREKITESLKKPVRELNIPHYIIEFKNEITTIDNIVSKNQPACTYCGLFRRYLLNKKALEIGATKLAIGHNLDDVVQTLVLSLARNEFQRVKRFLFPSEKEGFVPRIKPLMYIPEKEVALYTLLKEIPVVFDECPYAYNSLRYQIRKQINELEEKFPGTKFKMLSSFIELAKNLKDSDAPLKKCIKCGMPSSNNICKVCEIKEVLQ